MKRQAIAAALTVYALAMSTRAAHTAEVAPPVHTAACGNAAAPAARAASNGGAHRARPSAPDAAVEFTLDTIFLSAFECTSGGPYGGGEPSGPGGSVSATVVDQNNAPVSGQPAFLCGLNLCAAPQSTGAAGNVSISSSLAMTRPAFHVGDGISYPIVAVPLPPNMTTNLGTLQSAAFPALGSGAALTPGTIAVSGDVTLSIPANAQVAIDTLNFPTSDEQKLRTVSIPVNAASAPLLPCQACGFDLLYGVAPAETIICPAAQITIALPHQTQVPNDFSWAPGAIVEFWTTTLDVSQTFAPYAGWRLISYGHVSADGTSVTSETWGGLNFLNNLAVRLAP